MTQHYQNNECRELPKWSSNFLSFSCRLAHCIRITSLKADLQPVLFLDLQQGFRVASNILHRMMGVLRLSEVLEAGERVPDYALVE